MDSPEYRAVTQCSTELARCIRQSPRAISVQLEPLGIPLPVDQWLVRNYRFESDEKARKIVVDVVNRIKLNPQVFHSFIEALEAAGSWTNTTVAELKRTYLLHTGKLAKL